MAELTAEQLKELEEFEKEVQFVANGPQPPKKQQPKQDPVMDEQSLKELAEFEKELAEIAKNSSTKKRKRSEISENSVQQPQNLEPASKMRKTVPLPGAKIPMIPPGPIPQAPKVVFSSSSSEGATALSSSAKPSTNLPTEEYNPDYYKMEKKRKIAEQKQQQLQAQNPTKYAYGSFVGEEQPNAADSDDKKKKKNLRVSGSKLWEDKSLEEWPENDFRIFVGDLGNEVTDQVLSEAFQQYPSFQKAKVVRDKRGKTKGYGFVSLLNSEDFLKAMTEMNGKFVGNRPCRLKRSKWEQKNLTKKKQ